MTLKLTGEPAPPAPPAAWRAVRLRTPGDVRRTLATVANGLLRGTMDPNVGSKVAYVLTVLLKTLEAEEVGRQEAAEKPSPEDFARKISQTLRLMHETVPPPTVPPGEGNG